MRDYNIESDLKQEKFEVIKLVQGDKGNKLTINVLEDGQPVNLTGCSITAKYKRADGQVINGSVINISNNSFDAVIDSDITKVSGTLKMLFSIEKDDVKVSTFLLLADVREGLLENTGSSGGSTGGGEVTVDLSNYYKKNETYSKAQIDSQFKDIVNKIDNIGTSQSTKQSILKGKKICVLGDSITDKTYHSTKNYHDFIKEKTGCTIYNHGKDSWTIVQLCDEVAKCENDSDIITLFAGTNDWHIGKIPLGEITDISKSVSVCGAIDEIFNLIINKFPTKTFLVFTPLPRTNPHSNWTNYTNDRGYSLEQLVDKIKEKCKQYSIPCYDLYRNSGVHANNSASLKYYYNDEAIHPNIRYHEILGINKMLPFILDNILFVEDTINKPCTNITLNNSALTFTDKTPQTLTATVTPTDTTDTITWSVNPTGICSVNNGVVTPIAKGTCNITATCGTKSATCGVEVESLSIDDSRRITMNNYNRGLFDLTTLVQNPKTQLSTVKLRIKGSHFENCEFMSASSVTVFSDNTGELNNSSYIGMSSPCSYNTDSLGYFECNWEVNNTYQTEYLKVPVVVKATNPNKECSFIIDDLQVLIDDVKVSILKLGGFFKDKETLTGDINYILNYVNQLS